MQPRLLKKNLLPQFLEKIREYGELIAPQQTDTLRFLPLEDTSRIVLEGHPLFTIKKYLYPEKHEIFRYEKEDIHMSQPVKQYVIFGVRLCDINACLKLDKLFLDDEVVDDYYKKARENLILIGLNCETPPKEVCFCESMDLKDFGYDLFFCDAGEDYHIKIGSERGKHMVEDLPESYFTPEPIRTEKKLEKKDFKKLFEHEDWKEEAKRCINCGACTHLCPDCMCFDVFDDPGLNPEKGSRMQEWDSCQFKDFTQVAGGLVFREDHENRFKHRIFHKVQYFNEKFGEYMCTGCGRCIEGCPTGIDFVEILNRM